MIRSNVWEAIKRMNKGYHPGSYACVHCGHYAEYPYGPACRTCVISNNNIPNKFINRYLTASREEIKPLASSRPDPTKMICITDVKFNGPATIVFWSDDTKTVVKCSENDVYDKEKGLAMAIVKKIIGNNNGSYYRKMKEWIKEDQHD